MKHEAVKFPKKVLMSYEMDMAGGYYGTQIKERKFLLVLFFLYRCIDFFLMQVYALTAQIFIAALI